MKESYLFRHVQCLRTKQGLLGSPDIAKFPPIFIIASRKTIEEICIYIAILKPGIQYKYQGFTFNNFALRKKWMERGEYKLFPQTLIINMSLQSEVVDFVISNCNFC